MKRLTLLLLLALMAWMPVKAQSPQTFGPLFDESGSSFYVPVNGNWVDEGNHRSEFIINKDLLSGLKGKTITSMTFYITSVASKNWGGGFKVYLAEVEQTNFSNLSQYFTEDACTVVYDGGLDGRNATMTINFSNQFYYDGGNLLVGFHNYSSGSFAAATFKGSQATSVANCCAFTGTDGGNGFNRLQFIPKVLFTYEQGSSCNAPTNLDATNVTSTSATLTWNAGGSETAWNLRYKKTSASEWTTVNNLSNTTYPISNLEANTEYQFQVQADCGGEQSTWASKNFTTLCDNTCKLKFELKDSYGDGWNGASLQVKNASDSKILAEYTISSGSSYNVEQEFCDGMQLQFYWIKGNYDSECSFIVYDKDNQQIYSLEPSNNPNAGILYTYTMSCSNCPKPTDVAATPAVNSATINWNGTGNFELRYKKGDNAYIDVPGNVTSPYTLNGLNASTAYIVEVRSNCGDAQSAWVSASFTTDNVPGGGGGSATTVFTEGFEGGTSISSDAPSVGNNTHSWYATKDSSNRAWVKVVSNPTPHNGNYQAGSPYYGPNYLVSPQLTLEGSSAELTFWSYNSYPDDGGTNSILISTTGYTASNFTDDAIWTASSFTASWVETTVQIPSKYLNTPIYIAFLYEGSNGHSWRVDDISIDVAAGSALKTFTTNGAWNVASNWSDGAIPTTSDNIVINAPATITSIAQASNIYLGPDGSITIAEGGQLINSNNVGGTIQKSISAYNPSATPADGWNFIATPMVEGNAASTVQTGTYNLYRFNDAAESEWENIANHSDFTTLVNGQGYLYANASAQNFSFSGTLNATNGTVTLKKADNDHLAGWNLVGNPFPCNATVNASYYIINEYGNALAEATSGTIPPCNGILVKASSNGESLTFTKVLPSASIPQPVQLQMEVSEATRGAGLMDNASINFNSDSQLEKFYFNENSCLYIPQDGKDYAIVSSDAEGTMPVCFKAPKNGQYTLSFANVSEIMDYLHLIDNLTGADIDLMANPSYTFSANTSDYASRFKLMFRTNGVSENNNEANFAIVNGKHISIIDAQGRLEVVDMMGRVLSSTNVNGSYDAELNLSAGIYVLHMNGMTQKIVVR